MNFRKTLRSKQGFTLVELMVVGAIMSVLMLAFTGYIFQQTRQNKMNEARQNFSQLKTNILDSTSQVETLSATEGLQYSTMPP